MNIETVVRKPVPVDQANNGVYPESKPKVAEPEVPRVPPVDQETLRRVGWEIGERKGGERFEPAQNHVGLAMVSPGHGYAHWRIRQQWVNDTAWSRGERWFHCRLILRLYDVSFIQFTGLNANAIRDVDLPGIVGQTFFTLPRPGTWQVAEVGFLLRNGEFVPASRSHAVQFAGDSVSPRHDHAALLVDDKLGIEEVGNLWEQDRVLQERRKPKLRQPLRFASFTFEAPACGQNTVVGRFAAELAAQQAALGHHVHLFVPACPQLKQPAVIDGVNYHPLEVRANGSPIERALSFAHAVEHDLNDLPPFDMLHVHEWMAGQASWVGSHPTVLSLSSLESVRLAGNQPSELSREIQKLEEDLVHAVDVILTPEWMRSRTIGEFGLDGSLVQAFPMEAKLADEWACPLDYGHVKMSIGFGPMDQLLLFVGPLEHAAGPDLLIEALPTLLARCPGTRVAFCGAGGMHGHLEWLAHNRGVAHAVRVLGHVDWSLVVRLMRSAEALALPSRYRVPHDDAVVDMARRAGRPVVTTHGGPAYLVKHEENGVLTYDNPNSMVWALERILREPGHAAHMGQAGKRGEGTGVSWGEVARRYLELVAQLFPELAEQRNGGV